MLIVLIVVAALLVVAIMASIVTSNRSDDNVLGTAPGGGMSSLATSPSGTSTRSKFEPDSGAVSTSDFDQQRLQVGAKLTYPQGSGRVIGAIRLNEDGWEWTEYLIEDRYELRWYLSVENENGLQLTAFTAAPLAETPGAAQLTYQGATYSKLESGTARYNAQGQTDTERSGTCDYIDYRGPGGDTLSFERFDGGQWELSVGRSLDPGSVTILQ